MYWVYENKIFSKKKRISVFHFNFPTMFYCGIAFIDDKCIRFFCLFTFCMNGIPMDLYIQLRKHKFTYNTAPNVFSLILHAINFIRLLSRASGTSRASSCASTLMVSLWLYSSQTTRPTTMKPNTETGTIVKHVAVK